MTPSANPFKAPKLPAVQAKVAQDYIRQFSQEPSILVSSPGRINLIGEHTDYNNGFVLPAAIDKNMHLAISRREDNKLRFYASDFQDLYEGNLANLVKSAKFWPNYINGVIRELVDAGFQLSGLDLVVGGDIPAGAGLSSSAALECSVVFALNELFDLGLSRMDMVRIARAAENNFVGLQCGIMDMFASVFGKKDHAILLDCRSLKHEYIPLDFHQHAILLMDTRVKHSLASGEYNVRREQCEMGVKALRKVYPQVQSLRDANRAMIEYSLKDRVPDLVYHRCKYVVEENLRLQVGCEALKRNDLVSFGKKMFASHIGLSKLYDVSCPELDYLVELAKEEHAIVGARMMGGGFGGCTINIIRKTYINEVVERMSKAFRQRFATDPLAYICNISEGTHLESER